MGPILERTIHTRTKGIDLDLRLADALPGPTWRQLHAEVQAHRSQPIPGTLGPVEIDGQGRALRLGFPSFDRRTTRLDSVVDHLRGQPALAAGLLSRVRVIGRRMLEAGRSPDVGDPGAVLVHPEGRVAVLGIGTPLLRRLLVSSAEQSSDLEAELRRLAQALSHPGGFGAPPKAAEFGRLWRAAVGAAGLKGAEVLSGPPHRSTTPRPKPAPASSARPTPSRPMPTPWASTRPKPSPSASDRPAPGPSAPAPLRLALPEEVDAPRPSQTAPSVPTVRPSETRRSPQTPAGPSPHPEAAKPSPPKPSLPASSALDPPALAALAAASPEAQMEALRAAERPLRAPPQALWVTLSLLLIGAAFVILFQTHRGSDPGATELAPPIPRPLTGPGYQAPLPSAIGRPPGAVPGPGARAGAAPTPEGPKLDGLLSIVSKPSGATVRLDGELLGKTPVVVRRGLSDRKYEVSIQMAGYETWAQRLRPDPETGALSAIVELRRR